MIIAECVDARTSPHGRLGLDGTDLTDIPERRVDLGPMCCLWSLSASLLCYPPRGQRRDNPAPHTMALERQTQMQLSVQGPLAVS